MKELKYAYIDFVALNKLDISINEYLVCDIIYKLQAREGFCYASHEYLGKCINITDSGVKKILKRLIEKGLVMVVEKQHGKTNKIIMSDLWHDTVVFCTQVQSVSSEVQSSDTEAQSTYTQVQSTQGEAQSTYYNKIYNNINNKSNNKRNKIYIDPNTKDLINYFYKKISPTTPFNVMYANYNKTAAATLLSTLSKEEVYSVIDRAVEIGKHKYAPKPASVQDLATKFSKIKNFIEEVKPKGLIITNKPTKTLTGDPRLDSF